MFFAIEERAYELGYDVLLAQTLNKPEREDTCLRRLLSRRVDGLFITPVYRFEAEARIYQEIVARKMPTVLLGSPAPFCKNFASVEIEELVASYQVTKHLLGLGHKKIAYLTGPPAAPWAHERFEGYRRAFREAGLEVDDKLVFAAGNTLEDGTKAALQMLNENCHPTAIQTVSDMVAIGCAETLAETGRENSRRHFHRRLRKHARRRTLPRAADDREPAEIPSGPRGGRNDDGLDSRRKGGVAPTVCGIDFAPEHRRAERGLKNIQHPTSNIQHPMKVQSDGWRFGNRFADFTPRFSQGRLTESHPGFQLFFRLLVRQFVPRAHHGHADDRRIGLVVFHSRLDIGDDLEQQPVGRFVT